MSKIILYTIGCPICTALEKKLDANNIEYDKFEDKDKMIEMGMSTMPILEVDGVRMKYAKAIKWINERN